MSADPYAALAQALGGRLLGRRRLKGGVSADVHAIEVTENSGARIRYVVRHLPAAQTPEEVSVVRLEHALLGALAPAPFPTQRPRLLDLSGATLPGPFLVLDYIEGSTEAPPEPLPQMAELLAALHAWAPSGLPALPVRDDPVSEALTYLPADFYGAAAALRAEGPAPSGERALLHGDFWSGNLLWRGSEIVGLIDWEDAAVGDPLCDLAGARVELVWSQGFGAAERFTERYLAATGRPIDARRLATWELFTCGAGMTYMPRWGLPAAQLDRQMRACRAILERAARAL